MIGSPARNVTPGKWDKAKDDRFEREWKLGRFQLELSRHINRQCVTIGGGFNWNYKPSLELELLLWRFYVEYTPKKKK